MLDGSDSTVARKCEAFAEAGRKLCKDEDTSGSTGWYRLTAETPFSVVTEDWTKLQPVLQSLLLERGKEGWCTEGELHMQAVELLQKNWSGLCDLFIL